MKVLLCEKPSQARDIAKVIGANTKMEGALSGNNQCVTWAFGHLLELREPELYDERYKKWNLNDLPIVPQPWMVDPKKESKKQLSVIKKLLRSASEVCIATDADREGEMIGWEILEYCNFRGPITRLWLSALDESSIRKALASSRPGHQTYTLYQAGLARSRADWLVGINLTRAYTLMGQQQGVKGVLSVGRVQSPTLKLIVDRDREIAHFVSKPFWEVFALINLSGDRSFKAKWQATNENYLDAEGRCVHQAYADAVVNRCNNGTANIITVDSQPKKEAPPLCLDLSSLQQLASKQFNYGAQQVLDIAQSLYEKHKATTYPRTDCRYLPDSMRIEIDEVLQSVAAVDPSLAKLFSSNLLDRSLKSRVWNDAKITAHHAIIPTSQRFSMSQLSDAERHVYCLIRDHYLMQFMPEFRYQQTDIAVSVEDETFTASGRKVIQRGWRLLLVRQAVNDDEDNAEESQKELPTVTVGETGTAAPVLLQEKKTSPPKHYTEGTLIAAMKNASRFVIDPALKARLRETAGIGTEATRASIIETLLKRNLLAKKGRSIVSTETGQALVDSLPAVVTDPGMTALWEQALDAIAEGKLGLDSFTEKQSHFIKKLIHDSSSQVSAQFQQVKPTGTGSGSAPGRVAIAPSCPECGASMNKRKGSYGDFWGCTQYPGCKGIVKIGGRRKTTAKK